MTDVLVALIPTFLFFLLVVNAFLCGASNLQVMIVLTVLTLAGCAGALFFGGLRSLLFAFGGIALVYLFARPLAARLAYALMRHVI